MRVLTTLSFSDGCLQGIDTQRHRAAADQEEAVEPGATWTGLEGKLAGRRLKALSGVLTFVTLDVEIKVELWRIYSADMGG